MEESAEAQDKDLHDPLQADGKSGSRSHQALRAEDECRQLMVQYPEQQVCARKRPSSCEISRKCWAEQEFGVGRSTSTKGQIQPPQTDCGYAADQYPLYSKADQALWEAGMSYLNMGPRFRQQAATALRASFAIIR